jgi:hypothetical protein
VSVDRKGLREVIIQQYLLHEIEHHYPSMSQGTQPTKVVPRAHTLVDIYKCLHQGEFGLGHSIDNPANFENQLAREFSRAKPTATEPILENIAPDGSVLRLNLRPYRNLFKDNEIKARNLLQQVCLDSARIEKGDRERFFATLAAFREMNNMGEFNVGGMIYFFPQRMVDHFLREIMDLTRRLGNVPVLSHSPVYRQFNDPTYRVVDRVVLKGSPLTSILRQ